MPQSNKKAFTLRLDPALYERLEHLAGMELRSVNAEIEVLLREALSRRGIRIEPAQPVRRGRPPKDKDAT